MVWPDEFISLHTVTAGCNELAISCNELVIPCNELAPKCNEPPKTPEKALISSCRETARRTRRVAHSTPPSANDPVGWSSPRDPSHRARDSLLGDGSTPPSALAGPQSRR